MEDQSKNDDCAQKYKTTSVEQLLTKCLKELQLYNKQIIEQGTNLHMVLFELQQSVPPAYLSGSVKTMDEHTTHLVATANAMAESCSRYLKFFEAQKRNCDEFLQCERDKRIQLEEIIEQLAMQHSILEQAIMHHQVLQLSSSLSTVQADEHTEFYDARHEETLLNLEFEADSEMELPCLNKHSSSRFEKSVQVMDNHSNVICSRSDVTDSEKAQFVMFKNDSSLPAKRYTTELRLEAGGSNRMSAACTSQLTTSNNALARAVGRPGQRRTRVPNKPNHSLNLWTILKNCIGKELTKIPIPVNFSEPLSMLQRLTEDYEYAQLLDHAATLIDPCEQLAYITAFTVSSYATTAYRTCKPFNPLLGETYECDRTADLGWRYISEQVCHHPPIAAHYCEGKKWKCWQEFSITTKFRGKYLQITPLGTSHLEFLESGNHYTWKKPLTVVHNIIVGTLWIDQRGDVEVVNHKDGSKCHLSYIPYSYFSRGMQRKVKGCVIDKNGQTRWLVTGTWDKQIEIAPVISQKGKQNNITYQTGPCSVIWTQTPPPKDSAKYYNFTIFACQLNQIEEGVAPTDSRHRPDQRLMEEGKWDEANEVKLTLEEKQRAARRQRDSSGMPYEPVWFKREMDTITGTHIHIYKQKYWECKRKQDWSKCQDIFSI